MWLASVDRDAMRDAETGSRVRDYFARIESAYATALERAVERGELVADATQQPATARGLFVGHVTLGMPEPGSTSRSSWTSPLRPCR
ncbi:MAG: hypothetical protein WBL35_16260, partial [Ornithinibacter sp.]